MYIKTASCVILNSEAIKVVPVYVYYAAYVLRKRENYE
jgi:hypothetical protein